VAIPFGFLALENRRTKKGTEGGIAVPDHGAGDHGTSGGDGVFIPFWDNRFDLLFGYGGYGGIGR